MTLQSTTQDRVKRMNKKVTVLGAGIQGVCVALALRYTGYNVTLIDKSPDCLLRASLRNEGKIHLGFIFSKDNSFQTSELMLRSALAFGPLLDKWLGQPIDWAALRSRMFTYAILPDSMVSAEELFANYTRIDQLYADLITDPSLHYLGERPNRTWWPQAPTHRPKQLDPDIVQLADTSEVAIHLERFRAILKANIDQQPGIETRYNHRVQQVQRTASGFRLEGDTTDGERWEHECELVVNCLWEGRLPLDAQLGLVPQRPWLYRLKYRFLGQLPSQLMSLPSLSFVLGRYGDIVVNDSGRAYISWYPVCMKGSTDSLATPPQWEAVCDGRIETELARQIQKDALAQFDRLVPGLRHTEIDTVDAGIIFSWGNTDIDDPASELHNRHDVGVLADDGYFSIDTGKMTCGPLFAQQLLNHLS